VNDDFGRWKRGNAEDGKVIFFLSTTLATTQEHNNNKASDQENHDTYNATGDSGRVHFRTTSRKIIKKKAN
jgi:hypothetical protein